MKKYIHFAKALKPQLTKEAADIIVEEYTRLRNQDLYRKRIIKLE